MSYDLRDHTADVAVEATATTLSALFEAVADGLAAASCESVPETGKRFALSVSAESREALLFDFLDQLIYERDVRLVLPVDHRCDVSNGTRNGGDGNEGWSDDNDGDNRQNHDNDESTWTVEATARGVPLSDVAAREIKAVTYSEMTIERRGDEWYAYVVLDV